MSLQASLATLFAQAFVLGARGDAGIYPDWPAGFAMRGQIETSSSGTTYSLRGVGYCRGGPPGGAVATAMVSIVRLSGNTAPNSAECLNICASLARCTGVELRNSNDWCELQIPTLKRLGDGSDNTNTDWFTGSDAATENSLTADFNTFSQVAGGPAALTTVKPQGGFYCWLKQVDCSAVSADACALANRYPCEESFGPNQCGPCVPLHIAQDGTDERLPGPPTSTCVPDPSVELPTLRVALGSPWFGGRGHDEALYLAMIYGVRKAWLDQEGPDLIPIPVHQRLSFGFNITGHTDTWAYTLSADQLSDFGLPSGYDTRVENHPMSGLRAMAALKQDDWMSRFGIMEPEDEERTRPHCVIGSTPFNSLSGVLPHTNADLPLSHAATFYETPVFGWAFRSKEFADKTSHKYYLRVNRVGLDYHHALVALIDHFGYKRVGVVTSGTNRKLVRGLQETLGTSVEMWVEDMGLESECSDGSFDWLCHMKLVDSMARLREQDARVIIHEQGAMTQLENYWTSFSDVLRNDTLLIQVGVLGDCTTPMLPPVNGENGLDVLWENFRKASNLNNRGDWDKMPGDCRVCPNWAFRDLPAAALSNRTFVAEYNFNRPEGIYDWSGFCPEKPTIEDILNCSWCDHQADFWIAPTCEDELETMRQQFRGSMCIGVARKDDEEMIDRWTDYLAGLTAAELVEAGAPEDFFQLFEPTHPLFQKTNVTLEGLWAGSWRRSLREKASLIDSLLLSVVAFNTWVRAAGDSQDSLLSTALRTGWRTVHNTAIINWLSTIRGTNFQGLTGPVEFNDAQERRVDYAVYSAQGPNLAFSPVASFVVGGALNFTTSPIFNDGTSVAPLDREPACPAGQQYTKASRGCSPCPLGFYCAGDPSPLTRVPGIACAPGKVAPSSGYTECVSCPVGTIPNAERTECETCVEGRHASEAGSPFCSLCAAGKYWSLQLGENASLELMTNDSVSDCLPCSRGSYQEEAGKTFCDACPPGLKTQSVGAISSQDCMCDEGFYLPLGDSVCLPCPRGMICAAGSDMRNFGKGESGAYPMLLPRYWSTAEDPLSVYQCLDSSVCPGLAAGQCGLGAEGLVCAQCPPLSYRQGATCMPCNAVEASKAIFPIGFCLLICPVIAFMYFATRTTVVKWSSPKTGLMVCATVMLMHFQIQGLLWTFNLFFPPSLAYTWGTFSELVDGLAVLRPRCAGVTSFEGTFFLNVSLPLFVVFCFLLTFGMSRLSNLLGRVVGAQADGERPGIVGRVSSWFTHVMDGDHLFSCFGALMETFFVAIAKVSMSLFHCYQHPNGQHSLFISPDILCDSPQRQQLVVVALAAIFLYCVCGSAVAIFVLVRAPQKFEVEPHFQRRWRFLLSKYRPDVHWWSAVLIARSLLLSITTIVFEDGKFQLLFVIILLMIYGFATNHLKPWRHVASNIFDVTMAVMLIAAASAMFRFSSDPLDMMARMQVDATVTIYTQATNFIPQAVALVFGGRLVYLHFHPEIQEEKDAILAENLETIANSLANSANGGAQVKGGIVVLSEIDKKALEQAMDVLLAESQIRLFNLRKTLSLKELSRGSSRGSSSELSKKGSEEGGDNSDSAAAARVSDPGLGEVSVQV